MIKVNGLTKTFRVTTKAPGLKGSLAALFHRKTVEKKAVRDVTFNVDEGEIVGLLGANGAGKTTVTKMLAGIIHPSSGDATVLGYRPWERDDALRRQIALIMGQKAQLWWDLPAADGFLLLRDIYGVPNATYRENVDQLATLLGVTAELNVPIRRLSLGERMKMELIAALLHSPRVVYLDEPTIGLDLNAQRTIRDFILKYRAERKPAMLLTSHYMDDIESLCKRILILRDGELIYDGSLERVVAQYARHKVVTAHLKAGASPPPDARKFADLGEVLEADANQVKLRVLRGEVADAAAAVLEREKVADLTIEEPDVASIIAGILEDREGVGP